LMTGKASGRRPCQRHAPGRDESVPGMRRLINVDGERGMVAGVGIVTKVGHAKGKARRWEGRGPAVKKPKGQQRRWRGEERFLVSPHMSCPSKGGNSSSKEGEKHCLKKGLRKGPLHSLEGKTSMSYAVKGRRHGQKKTANRKGSGRRKCSLFPAEN